MLELELTHSQIDGNRKQALKNFIQEIEDTIEHNVLKQEECMAQLDGFYDTKLNVLLLVILFSEIPLSFQSVRQDQQLYIHNNKLRNSMLMWHGREAQPELLVLIWMIHSKVNILNSALQKPRLIISMNKLEDKLSLLLVI